jgi:CDGSH-type Zn-finger protein
MMSNPELANYILARSADLKQERSSWDPEWQELSEHFLPRKADITSKKASADTQRYDACFDGSAIQAAATLANGQLAYITPGDSRWFAYDPPFALRKNDKAKTWYQECGEIVEMLLSTSNFYSEVHEMFFDDSVFGTYCLTLKPGKSHPFVFSSQPCGSYTIAENDEGLIDTRFFDLELDVIQAVKEFGEENLSEKLRKHFDEFKKTGKGGTQKFKFIHASKHVCRVGGFDEKPFFSGRHVKTSFGPYGVSPAWNALPDARQLNFLAKQLDALAEQKAFPRFLVPDTHEGEIDLRAAGATYFDAANPNAVPKEWLTAGDYNIGLERENRKTQSINQAMHVDLFRMFAALDKQMTAREVAERAGEKLAQFSPAFARKTTEFLTPCLQSLFGMALRGGFFPAPPKEVALMQNGQPVIAPPNINYISRIALALKAMQNMAWARTMEISMPIWQLRPDLLDNYDLDQIERDRARNEGQPANWLRDKDDVEQMRQARAEAQARQAEMEQAALAADAAGKIGGIKQDSAVMQGA